MTTRVLNSALCRIESVEMWGVTWGCPSHPGMDTLLGEGRHDFAPFASPLIIYCKTVLAGRLKNDCALGGRAMIGAFSVGDWNSVAVSGIYHSVIDSTDVYCVYPNGFIGTRRRKKDCASSGRAMTGPLSADGWNSMAVNGIYHSVIDSTDVYCVYPNGFIDARKRTKIGASRRTSSPRRMACPSTRHETGIVPMRFVD
jgi:hypothetical protein